LPAIVAIIWKPALSSLRSKRFRGAFRRFEAFFASWTRENWGERKKAASISVALAPIFAPPKSEKRLERAAENPTETLATQAKPLVTN